MSFSVLWHGHSNMQIFSEGVNVLIDPFFEGNPFAPDWRSISRPDVVLVTHDHGDHLGQACDIARETGAVLGCIFDLAPYCIETGVPASQVTAWSLGGTAQLHGVRVTMTPAFHSCERGVPVGFVLELPDMREDELVRRALVFAEERLLELKSSGSADNWADKQELSSLLDETGARFNLSPAQSERLAVLFTRIAARK